MPYPWARDPLVSERALLRLKAEVAPLTETLLRALRAAGESRKAGDDATADRALYRLLRLVDELEPHPLVIEVSTVVRLMGVEPFVFSLGHHQPDLFVVHYLDAIMGARGDCGCGGALQIPAGAVGHEWLEPPADDGAPWRQVHGAVGADLLGGAPRLAREWDAASRTALPVTVLAASRQQAARIAEVLSKAPPRAKTGAPR